MLDSPFGIVGEKAITLITRRISQLCRPHAVRAHAGALALLAIFLQMAVDYVLGLFRRLSQCLNPKTFLMCNLYSPARRSFVIRFLGAGQPRPSNTRVSVGLLVMRSDQSLLPGYTWLTVMILRMRSLRTRCYTRARVVGKLVTVPGGLLWGLLSWLLLLSK